MIQLPPALLDEVYERLTAGVAPSDPELAREVADRVVRYLRDTAERTVTREADGTVFVITGDIPAMWLRDSAAQLAPLLRLVAAGVGSETDRAVLVELLAALLRRHWFHIADDPYANAFNRVPEGACWDEDATERDNPWAWERKFELDSLSYGPDLAWRLWRATGDVSWADENFVPAARAILATVRTEQDHEQRSAYRFEREDCPASDTLVRSGRGGLTAPTGLVWAGFRPSDDACELGFNVPGNHFLALALDRLGDLLEAVAGEAELASEARERAAEIRAGLEEHGTMPAPTGGRAVGADGGGADGADGDDSAGSRVWAYEVDGRGGALFMDDANVPSLLALPYLGCVDADSPRYRATRAAVLSDANPYWYRGTALAGVGSPHTPPHHVWPIALAIEGLTSGDTGRMREILAMLIATDGGTGMMHEGVDVEDPARFTRDWFSWANEMFVELALACAGVER